MRGWGQRNGRAAGCQERQRQKEMKVQRQTPRLREGDTDRQTDACARVHTHTHTHTHREAETDGDTERVTERQQTGDRQGREDGIRSETDTLAQPVTHLRGRPRGRSSFPKGGGVSLGPGPGWTRCPGAGGHPWGPQDFLEAEVSKVPFGLAT